ncbi:hypothetical protein LCGC14_1402850 [marine sediment metagenome]|uniref:Ion transport domain-containing protein n=1 Tax=marine sediment metagenome TaxID=412755 RepID=A0A0F9JWH9_9ZZZZ
MIIIAIEILVDRNFYRVGTTFTPGKVYDTIMLLGDFSRVMMVLLNFSLLGLIIFKNRNHMNKIFSTFVEKLYYLSLKFPDLIN